MKLKTVVFCETRSVEGKTIKEKNTKYAGFSLLEDKRKL